MSDTLTHTERKPRTKTRGGLFVTDTELIEKLKVPARTARQALEMLNKDGRTGFPPKQKLWGDRRYWPAVEQWLTANSGLILAPSPRRDK